MTNEQKDRFDISTSTRKAKCQECGNIIIKSEPRLRFRNKWTGTMHGVSKHLCISCLAKMCESWNQNVNPSRKDDGIRRLWDATERI